MSETPVTPHKSGTRFRRSVLTIAAMGWYLLLPGINWTDRDLRRWEHLASYDTAAACETDRITRIREKGKALGPVGTLDSEKEMARWVRLLCIASNDPRLGEARP